MIDHPRRATTFFQWARDIERGDREEDSRYKGHTALGKLSRFADHLADQQCDEQGIRSREVARIRECLLGEGERGSARLAGREWGRVWAQIVDVGFAPTGMWQLMLPPGAKLNNVRRQLQHKLVVNRGVGRRQGIFVAASASWH